MFVHCFTLLYPQTAQTYADDTGLMFLETSAKVGTNIEETFLAIGKIDGMLSSLWWISHDKLVNSFILMQFNDYKNLKFIQNHTEKINQHYNAYNFNHGMCCRGARVARSYDQEGCWYESLLCHFFSRNQRRQSVSPIMGRRIIGHCHLSVLKVSIYGSLHLM